MPTDVDYALLAGRALIRVEKSIVSLSPKIGP